MAEPVWKIEISPAGRARWQAMAAPAPDSDRVFEVIAYTKRRAESRARAEIGAWFMDELGGEVEVEEDPHWRLWAILLTAVPMLLVLSLLLIVFLLS